MIRREEPDAMWVIHQAAHTYISGQIAEHWTGGRAMTPIPRDELLIAAYGHDAGWAAVEQAPRINGAGLPRTFTEMPLEDHFTIWRDSIQSVFVQNRYAALLTSLHCTALYEMRRRFVSDPPSERAAIQTFLDVQHAWECDLIDTLGSHPRYTLAAQPDHLAANVRLLQVWDYLSLLLCMSAVNEQTYEDVPFDYETRGVLQIGAGGQRSMVIDPYPLDQPLTLWIEARQVIGAPFGADMELQAALASVPYKPIVFEVGPL